MYLAIDIGGTKTLLAVFNEHGDVVFKHKTATDKNYGQFIKDLDIVIKTELKDFKFKYCCCAAPGLIKHKEGIATRFGNLDWIDVPIGDDLEKSLPGTKVIIENDTKLAGLSEAILAHTKYKKVLYITISTGISAGVIVNGKIDPTLADAEPGQMTLVHDGKLQKWEDFAGGRALHQRYGKLASEINDPKIWREFASNLTPGIEQLLAVVQPEVVIIGGGVGAHFEKFAVPLHKDLKQLESPMVRIPPIIKAQRPEEAVIYGCYDLIRQQV